jgi:hypothetical protein
LASTSFTLLLGIIGSTEENKSIQHKIMYLSNAKDKNKNKERLEERK